MHFLGQQDVDLDNVSANDMLTWGLNNMWRDGEDGGYGVRSGRIVSSFGFNPNSSYDTPESFYWERAYPTLYPYGLGGAEIRRPVPLSLSQHVRWSLLYFDKRFRKHSTYPFNAFSILQRREGMISARIQMRRGDFQRDAHLFQTITYEKMKKAAEEEANGLQISDYACRVLMKHMHATATRVMGSDAARYRLRTMMWSQAYLDSPPFIWVTINPDDVNDPIVQFLCGEDISLDDFNPEHGPASAARSANSASDPFAAAEYFNLIIRAVLECLFAVKSENGSVKSKTGILGEISGYFGVVETQGRGTLHLHMLIWLKGSPSGGEFGDLLKTESFRERVKAYIRENIHARCPGTESEEDVRTTPVVKSVAWQRLPSPSTTNEYKVHIRKVECDVARSKQIHVCKTGSCETIKPNGRRGCKRKAPWPTAREAFIEEDGSWGPERTYGYANNWNPVIATHCRCNHDMKILTNGSDSAKLTFYCTCYAAKRQKRSHNASALLMKNYAFKQNDDAQTEGIQEAGRLMLIRCLEIVRKQQELSAAIVLTYLMGWGDVYQSHRFVPVYWTSFISMLFNYFPDLKKLRDT